MYFVYSNRARFFRPRYRKQVSHPIIELVITENKAAPINFKRISRTQAKSGFLRYSWFSSLWISSEMTGSQKSIFSMPIIYLNFVAINHHNPLFSPIWFLLAPEFKFPLFLIPLMTFIFWKTLEVVNISTLRQ